MDTAPSLVPLITEVKYIHLERKKTGNTEENEGQITHKITMDIFSVSRHYTFFNKGITLIGLFVSHLYHWSIYYERVALTFQSHIA